MCLYVIYVTIFLRNFLDVKKGVVNGLDKMLDNTCPNVLNSNINKTFLSLASKMIYLFRGRFFFLNYFVLEERLYHLTGSNC